MRQRDIANVGGQRFYFKLVDMAYVNLNASYKICKAKILEIHEEMYISKIVA